jgi:thymidylate kinase
MWRKLTEGTTLIADRYSFSGIVYSEAKVRHITIIPYPSPT